METPSNIKTFKSSVTPATNSTKTSANASATPAIKHNTNPLSISKNLLTTDKSTRGPSCGLIVVDNFYQNAMATRDFILTQEFSVRGNYPGSRTISHATEQLRAIIQKYVEPFGGKITDFPLPSPATATGTGTAAKETYNGSFQYTTSRDRSWVHTDGFNNWAGVLFLTPDAPLSSGTGFFRFHDGTTCVTDQKLLNNKSETDTFSQDMTKWSLVDQVGNVFNRLVLFNANNFHMSMDYFGDRSTNGRLFQIFFFSTER
jgi:hypothetical protein